MSLRDNKFVGRRMLWRKLLFFIILMLFCHSFFRKPTSPPLPLREGPPLISVFSPQGRRGNRSSSSLVTISFYGWRTIRGLRQQRSCVFFAGMNPLSLKDLVTSCLVSGCLLMCCLLLVHCSLHDAGCLLMQGVCLILACSKLACC